MKAFTKETFENFLARMHMEDEPMVLDDDLPDHFDHWLSNLDLEMVILYAEKWHLEQLSVETTQIFSALTK